MKRFIVILLLLSLMLPTLLIGVQAALTGAVDILAEQCSIVISAPHGKDAVFTDADFRQALGVTSYPDLTILTLPDPQAGVLKLGELRVSAGQVIRRMDVGRLTLTPTGDHVEEATFTLRAGNLCGGAALSCIVRFTEGANTAPTATQADEACFFTTRKNATMWGTMAGYDPDGDDINYLIVTYPENGTLRDVDLTTGAFRYTPRNGFSGKDSFSYVVRDSRGNYSSISTVEIAVDKRTWDLSISDMQESAAMDAACRMVSANIMSAEYNGFAVYFHPSATINRAEFLVAAMKATGHQATTSKTWQYDDLAAIPVMARPYIADATAAGYITPTWEGGFYFRPDDAITGREAINLITQILSETPHGLDPALATSDAPLTRAEAACILLAASRVGA